jgi:hypothetical protein
MKKSFSVLLIASIVLILVTLLFGCAEWNQTRVEKKYGPPQKKETVDDKTIYYYCFSARSWDVPHNLQNWCMDLTFDKNGKLINKKEYVVQADSQNEQSDPQQIGPWLNTISGGEPPEIDITGRWHDVQGSGRFTWGEGHLRQEQDKTRGTIGDYHIRGVVSGRIVYLVFLYQGVVYYTARLEMFQDLLTGNYFGANDRKQIKGVPISLAKTVEPAIK